MTFKEALDLLKLDENDSVIKAKKSLVKLLKIAETKEDQDKLNEAYCIFKIYVKTKNEDTTKKYDNIFPSVHKEPNIHSSHTFDIYDTYSDNDIKRNKLDKTIIIDNFKTRLVIPVEQIETNPFVFLDGLRVRVNLKYKKVKKNGK